MSSSQTSLEQMLGVYKHVVDDVVSAMKDEFLNESVDLQVLEDLKQIWEQKLVQSGALSRPVKEPTAVPKSDSSHEKSQKSKHHNHHHQQQQQQQQPQQQQPQVQQPQQHHQQRGEVPLSVIQHTNVQQTSSTQPPPPLISQNTPTTIAENNPRTTHQSNTGSSSRPSLPLGTVISNSSSSVQASAPSQATASSSTADTTTSNSNTSTGGGGTSVNSDILTQAHLYSAMTPLMLPTGPASGLALGNLPYAAVQTPGGLSYFPLPVALNLQQQQQQQSESRNKDPSSNISQNDGPLPLPGQSLKRKSSLCTASRRSSIPQLDGPPMGGGADSSSEESDDSSESDVEEEPEMEDDDPLNSDDDADSDKEENVWDTDNTIVCQFEKVYRVRAKWKFALKDGIMNLKGHDYIFNRVNGEAEW